MKSLSRSAKVSIAAVVIVSLLVVVRIAAHAMWTATLSALFQGSFQVCRRDEPACYPHVVFNVADYLNAGEKPATELSTKRSDFMAWSPGGEKLAFSASQKTAALSPILYETQLTGTSTSDAAIYDPSGDEAYLLPGASDPNVLESYPRWSPDGNFIVFSRGPVGVHAAFVRFDLYAVAVDGGRGRVALPVEGAAEHGRGNYFPRFSPDGRRFLFCQCGGGDLIRSPSDIHLERGDLKGAAHRLECNVAHGADSWHSWSSNGRWLVFASRREGSIYAYLFLTQVDEAGHASPAVRLPMKEKPHASFNIPGFVSRDPGIREADLFNTIRAERKARIVRERKGTRG